MKLRIFSSLYCLLVSSAVVAGQSYKIICQRGAYQREIQVIYDNPMFQDSCKVYYKKGDTQPFSKKLLWKAEYTPLYCEQNAANLADKLKSWQWDCDKKPFKP